MNRRSVVQALGLGALVAPRAATQLVEHGLNPSVGATNGGPPRVLSASNAPWERAKLALADKETLDAIKSSLFEQNRTITRLDPDLASKRSFSLAAKIAFQRQRNVEAELAGLQCDGWEKCSWGIIEKFFMRRQ